MFFSCAILPTHDRSMAICPWGAGMYSCREIRPFSLARHHPNGSHSTLWGRFSSCLRISRSKCVSFHLSRMLGGYLYRVLLGIWVTWDSHPYPCLLPRHSTTNASEDFELPHQTSLPSSPPSGQTSSVSSSSRASWAAQWRPCWGSWVLGLIRFRSFLIIDF